MTTPGNGNGSEKGGQDPTLIPTPPQGADVLRPDRFTQVWETVQFLTDRYGEDVPEETIVAEGEEGAEGLPAMTRFCSIPMETNRGEVGLTTYTEEGRTLLADTQRERNNLKPEEKPLGHVTMDYNLGHSRIEGQLLFVDSGRIVLNFTCKTDYDDPFGWVSNECFSFLNRMGLGDIWFQYLREARMQEPVGHVQRDMKDSEAGGFMLFLGNQINREVTGQN